MSAFEYRTPGTRLWWGSVATWVVAAHRIDRRRFSSARNRALKAHAAALPLELIAEDTDRSALEEAVWLLKYGPPDLRRPQRGGPCRCAAYAANYGAEQPHRSARAGSLRS